MSALLQRLARFPLWAKIAAPVVVALLVVSGVAGASKNQGSQQVALLGIESSTSVQTHASSTVASVVATTTVPSTTATTVPPTNAPTVPSTTATSVAQTAPPTVPPTTPPTAAPTVPATVAETLPTVPPLPAPSGTDPRFDTCKLAKANGYGPYVRGEDVEYGWYRDGDSDGTVCE